jgi:hypothetical protein
LIAVVKNKDPTLGTVREPFNPITFEVLAFVDYQIWD